MLGNFTYCNPTKLYFGKDALQGLNEELPKYGKNVMLSYGGGSIKKNGIYNRIIEILKFNGKTVVEDPGIMPNPTVAKLYEGCRTVKENGIDLILAVGGGSVCDYAKAVSASAYCTEDPWEKYYLNGGKLENKTVPVGCVLTMVGTGSEMNTTAVLTNTETNWKIGHVFEEEIFPKFSILNPEFTYTLPRHQMVAGFFDVMSHILEQYFCGEDDNTSDYIMEGLLKSLIHSVAIAVKEPYNYEARSNIMWTATWALNKLVEKGKSTDWQTHMIGQAIGAYTNATHGMTLSAVTIPYLRYILPYGLAKFKRYAINVWNVTPNGKSDKEIANEGLCAMETWMKHLGLVMNLTDLGVTEDMLKRIADATLIMEGGYKILTRDEVIKILNESM